MFSCLSIRILARLGLLFLIIPAVTGCGRQEAVNLYVDAVMLNELDQKEQAVEKLNAAVQRDSAFALAYSLLGEIYRQAREYEKSAAAYEVAIRLNEWSFKDFFNLGNVYRTMERFDEAVRVYIRACQLRPEHFEAHLYTAKMYYKLNDYSSALEYGRQALSIDPNAGEVQAVLGDIYEARKDHDQAIASYKRALEIKGNKPDIMTSLAVAYLRVDRNKSAKELLLAVLEAKPRNNTACRYLGYCLIKLKQIDQAIDSYKQAINISNEDWAAHKGLGVAYMLKSINSNGKDFKELAVKHWKKSLGVKTNQPRLRKLLSKYSK